jgi:hypothetical protein
MLSHQEKTELTILLPCLNEAETLATCIQKAQYSLNQLDLKGEILIADNGSQDNSIEIAERHGARVVHVAEKGYGSALRGGIAAAQGHWILMADADDSYDLSDIALFVEKLRGGNDLVMGCRLPSGGGQILPGAMPWKHRWIGNPALSFLGRLFFKAPAQDFHCGMRAFSKEAIEQIGLRTTGMEFASEMLIKATLHQLRIAEVPITLHPDGRSRPPHLRSWRDGWRHLRFMLLFSPLWLFLVPGFLLILTGAILGGRLLAGPLPLGQIVLDTNTLLACAMSILLGVQVCVFAAFTRAFAATEKLLPPSRRILRLFTVFSLEKGLVFGVVLLGLGGIFLINALLYWKAAGFGAVPYPDSLRRVIPALTLLVLGGQTIFSSFFLSILGLPRK